jgi:protein-disulfide isomerase
MASLASDLGINGDAVKQHIDSSDGGEIQEDKSEIQQVAGSLGTPTFFIGNSEIGYTEISGAQPYPQMKPTIDQKIEEAENSDSTVGEDEYTLDNISFSGEPKLGDESATINIIEYSDFGCPWCAEWHGVDAIPQRPIDEEDSFRKVRQNYVETGDVQFVMKDYPVPRLHPEAMTAHKAANYVWENSPEDYWEFSQSIYEERDRW